MTAASVHSETEIAFKSRDATIASLKSRLDDITAEFMEKLNLLVVRMQERVELVRPEGDSVPGRGLKVKDSSQLLIALQNAASIELPKGTK